MAEIYLRGRIWWARGQDRYGRWWQKSTKQRDPKLAKVVAAKLDQELVLDAHQARNEATLEQALNALAEFATRFGRAPATLEIIGTKGRHLIRLLGKSTPCTSITGSDTTKYASKRIQEGASPHTAFKELRILAQALRRASKLGLYTQKVSPGDLIPDELDGAYVPRDRWLTESEYRLLLEEFGPDRPGRPPGEDRRDYVIAMCQTGVRLSELHGIEAKHVDVAEQLLHLDAATKTKGSRRTIPLSPVILEVLERRAREHKRGPLFPVWTMVQRDLDLACLRIEKKLNPDWKRPEGKQGHGARERIDGPDVPGMRSKKGLPPPKKDRVRPPVPFDTVTPNDCRRTFASWLAQSGVPLFHAAKLMGHGSTKMLERVYARLAPENARSAIAMLPASLTGAAPTRTGKLKRVK